MEVNAKKTEYMLLHLHQNAGQNYDVKIANRSFGNVSQIEYFGSTVTNHNLVQEQITRFNSGNYYYLSIQNLLSFRLLTQLLQRR
jgi:hypothetical protein